MTTRPTTDGDTAEALERVRECVETYEHMDLGYKDDPEAFAALDLITTRISEQEVELERAREAIREYFRSNGPHIASDGEWSSSVGYDAMLREYLESLDELVPKHEANPFDEHGNYRGRPTTQDQSESSGEG